MPPIFLFRFPRHPLLRWGLTLVGIALLVIFSMIGMVLLAAGAFALTARLAWLRWRGAIPVREPFSAPRATVRPDQASDEEDGQGTIIEGDFEVVEVDCRGAKRADSRDVQQIS
jgi:hypothetical protein